MVLVMKKSQIIEQLIISQFQQDFSELEHKAVVETEDEHHFVVTVISDAFINKKLLERQRMVYASLGDKFATGEIHALSLKTFTHEELKK
tara:strand:+ start:92 stop:361 length:270 start_codon:yes stop_codon:yes gene_type:complete